MVHFSSGFADRNAIFSNCEIFFVLFLDTTFFIQVNKRLDAIFTTVQIVRHGTMGRIQNPFADMKIRKECFEAEISFKESMRIMFGGWVEQRK